MFSKILFYGIVALVVSLLFMTSPHETDEEKVDKNPYIVALSIILASFLLFKSISKCKGIQKKIPAANISKAKLSLKQNKIAKNALLNAQKAMVAAQKINPVG